MADSEACFRAFMTHSPVASWIVDAEGRFEYVSPIYYRMFKVPTQDLTGKYIQDVYPPELAERYLQGNLAAIDAGMPVETEQPGLRPDGSPGTYLVVKFPIRTTDQRTLLCGMALDISERRHALASLGEANRRLETLAAAQAVHLRELAEELTRAEQRERDRLHELLHDEVQPLLVAARLSLSSLSERTPAEDRLLVATEASTHISRAIELARELSQQLSPPLVREQGLLPALEFLCRWIRKHHDLAVNLECGADVEPGKATERLLCFNAVRELLLNVAKHAGHEGVVHLSLRRNQGDLMIEVADHGQGYDPAAPSDGAGLANLRRRLSMYGGRLEVESRPGYGTLSRIVLPLAQAGAGRVEKRKQRRRMHAQDLDR